MDSNDRERRRRQRKERVLHTRVSDELDEALQDAARRLRVPVSNLVRNVLEDVFDVVEAVTENVGELVEDVVEEAQDFVCHLFGQCTEGGPFSPDERVDREIDSVARGNNRITVVAANLAWSEGIVVWERADATEPKNDM
jgi:predicted transcriptional regulator